MGEVAGIIKCSHDSTTLQGVGFNENRYSHVGTKSDCRKRHRFSKTTTTHSATHFAAPCTMGVGGLQLTEPHDGLFDEEDIVAVEVKCRNALRRKLGDLVAAKVSQHFGALQGCLIDYETLHQAQNKVSLDTLDL